MTPSSLPPNGIDPELRTLLQRHDPAEKISQYFCANLEMRITAQIINQPRATPYTKVAFMPLMTPQGWSIPWPIAGVLSVILGLVIGVAISVLFDTPVRHYTVASIIAGPWYPLAQ